MSTRRKPEEPRKKYTVSEKALQARKKGGQTMSALIKKAKESMAKQAELEIGNDIEELSEPDEEIIYMEQPYKEPEKVEIKQPETSADYKEEIKSIYQKIKELELEKKLEKEEAQKEKAAKELKKKEKEAKKLEQAQILISLKNDFEERNARKRSYGQILQTKENLLANAVKF